GSNCDGTRARPFAAVSADTTAAQTPPRPILVASGTYDSFLIPGGISVYGGCDTTRWICDGAIGPSVIAGTNSLMYVSGGSDLPIGTVHGFTVSGGSGAFAAVIVQNAVTLEDLEVTADGSSQTFPLGIYISSADTGQILLRR